MYKPTEPIRCPKCNTIVKVDLSKILTSNPPCYEWTCPNCGEKGNTKHGDIISFENQIKRATLPYIQKVGEPDPGVAVTTTNADNNTRNDVIPAWSVYSIATKCTICGEEFKFDGEHRICPKCREATVKLRGAVEGVANITPVDKSTVTNPKSTACNIPAPKWIQQGWECPKCGAILAPHQSCCPFCSRKENDWITTTEGTGAQPFFAEWTNKGNLTPPSGQYTNPYINTTISSGDINFPKGVELTLNQRGDIIDAE